MEHLGEFIVHHWQLWLAFITILFLVFINEAVTQRKKGAQLSPQAAVDLMNNSNAVVVDLRDSDQFNQGHIIGAISCKAEDFEQKNMQKYKNKMLILVCARGLQSPAVAAKIRTLGFQPLVLGGGIAAWQAADLPLVKK